MLTTKIFAPFVAVLATVLTTDARLNTTLLSLGIPQDVQNSWAMYAPCYPVSTYMPPPLGCQVVMVNLLQRHGARYPTKSDGKTIQKSVEKLKNATILNDPKLEFVKNWNYTLGIDVLVPFGAAQSFYSGEEHFTRYGNLVGNPGLLPFIRAADSSRVVDSAGNWSAGFVYASGQNYALETTVKFPQSPGSNNTLDNNMCPGDGKSTNETDTWTNVFASAIADRINYAAPDAKLNPNDVVNLIALCTFDTVAHEAPSPWCGLFATDEFASFEYYGDLSKYYTTGYGQKLGPFQGVGYVNELLARLTKQPVQDDTQTNHTLDNSSVTFPLNRTLYADFSHDDELISIYSAIGLFKQAYDLDPIRPDPLRTWVVSRMVPYTGRMITEKLECNCNGTGYITEGEYVRVLVNDAVQPLEFCGAVDGMCTLENFVQSQSFARNNGDGLWPLCFMKTAS